MAGRSEDEADFVGYVTVRWHDLVGGLEDAGVDPDRARLAAAGALLAHRRGWPRLVRDREVDVVVWAAARERAGLAPGPGEAVPHGVRAPDPQDAPEPWLDRAELERRTARRRTLRLSVVGGLVVAVLAAGWAWWAAQPAPPAVREEANPLPVVWYAEGDLHLRDVVVELPDVDVFVADGSAVVARMRSGDLVRVAADGDVSDTETAPAGLDAPPSPPPVSGLGPYDVLVQSVEVPDGGWAHLVDSSRRDGAQDAVRQSESGRRALVICAADGSCSAPRTIVGADGSIRLR